MASEPLVTITYDNEAEVFVSAIPVLSIMSQAETESEARTAVFEAAELHFRYLKEKSGNVAPAAVHPDIERMDYYERAPGSVTYAHGYLGDTSGWLWKDRDGTVHEVATLRDALDGARSTEKGPE